MLILNNLRKWRIVAGLSVVIGPSACTPDADQGAGNGAESAAFTGSPNIVIFYIDDLGYGDVASYGATGVDTPNIDRLAEGGMRFDRAVVFHGKDPAATCHAARCWPARCRIRQNGSGRGGAEAGTG